MRKNAKFYRNAVCGLFAAFALGGFQVAHAGYAQLASPQGFGGSAGSYTYAAAANDRVFGRVVHSAGSLTANVGGQSVKMGAAYRFAANAPRFAARALFVNPYVAVGIGIAAWLGSKYVWNEQEQQWKAIDGSASLSDGQLYRAAWVDEWAQSKDAACGAAMAASNANPYASESSKVVSCTPTAGLGFSMVTKAGNKTNYSFSTKPSSCPAGWYITTAGCTQTPPMRAVPEEEFVEDLAKRPMPQTVPQELPYPTPLPIEQPSPWINPTPGENPQSQPLRIPTGQPSPIPNTDPQQYRQPYVDIVPAPTPDNPFRVDVKPGETVSTDPNPVENPNPDGQDKPTEEQDKSLCEKHPDILACTKPELDVPDGEIPKVTKQITYAEEGGFGGGSCPSNVYANLHGKQTMVYEWTRTCSVVSTYIRPIILLLGAMGALFILIPGRDS